MVVVVVFVVVEVVVSVLVLTRLAAGSPPNTYPRWLCRPMTCCWLGPSPPQVAVSAYGSEHFVMDTEEIRLDDMKKERTLTVQSSMAASQLKKSERWGSTQVLWIPVVLPLLGSSSSSSKGVQE